MATEIERKFLVRSDAWRRVAVDSHTYRQGYICADEHRSVRVRVSQDAAWLTVKGATHGVRRDEFEYPVPREDALEMLECLCTGSLIEKTRYRVPVDRHVFEVDVFEGDNTGLVVVELELADADDAYPRPPWLGTEVSGLARYYNSSLAAYPFCQWSDDERAGRPA